MKHHDEEMLNRAIEQLRYSAPDAGSVTASAERIAHRLGIAPGKELAMENTNKTETIKSCSDVQELLGAYRAGTLSTARALLVEAHLHDCGECLRQYRSQPGHAAVDWATPQVGPRLVSGNGSASRPAATWRRPEVLGWTLATAAAILSVSFFVYRAYWQVPPGVRAEVQSIDGSAYLVSDAGSRPLMAGASLQENDHQRTAGGSRAVLRLSDGSTVEVNERSMLGVAAKGRNMTVSLDDGAVIVQAAKRDSGHLYVRTPDCRVAVTGTVFSVDAGIKGSRVAVLQGAVDVENSGAETVVHAGDQFASNANLSPTSLEEEVSWSQDREKYLGLVAQFAALRNRIGQIPFPGPRYSSDLLDRVPANTLLYVSVPNLGDFLSEANTVFHDQLGKSPELQQWWNSGRGNNTEELDALVEKLHETSRYLGDEVVIVGVKGADHPGFAVIADVNKSGLDDFLKQQFPISSPKGGLTVLDEHALGAVADAKTQPGGYALLREHEAIFAGDAATLRTVDAQFNAGSSGFASGVFGKQIAAAYERGAGIILAADLHQMIERQASLHPARPASNMISRSGFEGVQYLIAEHRETNGNPQNHLNLQFAGERQRVASWLAAPAPIGSLDFVSPNASFAVAALSKDPKLIADDMIAIADAENPDRASRENDEQKQIEETVRGELISNLGGDFLVSLDGPVLPTPSWKAVIEVRDSTLVQDAIEKLLNLVNEQPHSNNFQGISIDSSETGGQRFYAVHDVANASVKAYYTYADGFMIIAPSRALLIETMRTHTSGNTLARSAAFKALLPRDSNENCSAVAYQNLSPVLSPLLSQMSGPSADILKQVASDSKPTAICAWGEESRIEAASDSRLFGFDFLTLGALLHPGNQQPARNVKE